jgi:lipoate-protein ligase A
MEERSHGRRIRERKKTPGVSGKMDKAGRFGYNCILREVRIMKSWSLIIETSPLPGSWNMAVDEYLYSRSVADGRTFLRFYQWERPTASLGYSQSAEKAADLKFCRGHGIDVVRRMTGGKVVLHHNELTYSVASSDEETFTAAVRESYHLISQALLKGLEGMGLAARLAPSSPPSYARGTMPCFAFPARDEIEIGGRKIVGSAQKRTGVSFIQHGSVPLKKDEDLLRCVARSDSLEGPVSMTSLEEALGRPVPFEWAAARFAGGFSDFFGVELEPFTVNQADHAEIARIEAERYGNEAWTLRRPGA